MGTHPIFESDFDCLTEWLQFNLGTEFSDTALSPLVSTTASMPTTNSPLSELTSERKKSKSPRLTWSRLTSPTSSSRKKASETPTFSAPSSQKLHPHLQALWEANKDKAPFGNHITNGKKDLFPGPQQYIASLPTPLMGRARSSFDNQVLTLNFLIEVNKKLGIDTSKVENIVFPNIVRDENNVVKVVGGTAAPACAWTSTL